MVRANSFSMTDRFMKASLKKICWMDSEFTNGLMDELMKDNGRPIKCMDEVSTNGSRTKECSMMENT